MIFFVRNSSSSLMNRVYFIIEYIWNIPIREQYPNCDSIKSFRDTSFFLLTSIKSAMPASALSYSPSVLHRKLTCSSNFNSRQIVIPRITSILLDAMGKPSTIAVVSSLQLIIRRHLSLFSYTELLLNHPQSTDADVPRALMNDSVFFY